jgi:hypothetical protein
MPLFDKPFDLGSAYRDSVSIFIYTEFLLGTQ